MVALLPISAANAYADALSQEEKLEEELTPEEITAYNKQIDVYTAAVNEQDLLRRSDMLINFIAKYPEAELLEPYVLPAYSRLLFECSQSGKYKELEILAEKWLDLYPDNLEAIARAATAAEQLGHNEKFLKYLLIIYDMEPTGARARFIADTYDKMGNLEKYIEWCEKTFTYPEYSGDYTLRLKLVQRFLEIENIDKASTYAAKTLEVFDAAEKPDAAQQENIRSKRRICHHIIALKLYKEDKFQEAIKSFESALKTETYQEGFYRIGMCLWELKEGETAHDYFSAAELMGGEYTEKAKDYKEQLYKEAHNNTLIGIEKVHKRAQALIDSYSAPDAAQE
jgi:tetratricopeptide (TPR) repeat protein